MKAFGLVAVVPPTWDGRIYRRAADVGEKAFPIVHAATFPLPAERGDYGAGAVDAMGSEDVFVALCEFDPALAGRGLYSARGIPRLQASDFDPNALQRWTAGQSGCQRFFTQRNRPFSLYVVLGSHARRVPLTKKANQVIAGLGIS